ncbi:MAG: DHH family phosphoesterase [Paludibacteraceae bacterium]|nr:DHH family phosphoesterase [Paludibacteraceae bacterium]
MSLSLKLTSAQVQDFQRLVASAKRIVILTHMSPDGDAMGSSLGLKHYMASLHDISNREITVIVPNHFPSFLAWMPGTEEVLIYETDKAKADQCLAQADIAICADFNEPKRIGALGEQLITEKQTRNLPIILIDHHLNPDPFVDVCISYPDSPSASELVYRLIYQIEKGENRLPLAAAQCLYTGMMTDTGNFSFNSNYPEMYEIVGQLVALGVNKDAIYNSVFNQYSADRMQLMGYCLYKKMRLFPEHHTALIYMSRKELYRFNFQSGDAEGIVNLPLQISNIYYSVFMREDKVNPSEVCLAGGSKTKVKISLRSQGDRPVNIFAHDIFGGGGHKNASGGEHYGPVVEAVQKFLDNYEKYFNK